MSQLSIAVVLGAVQGLTEFLPVSSSGHLILVHQFFPNFISSLGFDIALHIGTLLALLALFRQEVWKLMKIFWNVVLFRSIHSEAKLLWMILLATIPGAIAGFLLEKTAEIFFRSSMIVGIALVLGGILIFIAERLNRQRYSMQDLTYSRAIIIGIAQMFALIPGISRSGSTIIAGLFVGLQRKDAVRFSFLLSMPIIAGAIASSVADLPSVLSDLALRNEFFVGIFSSFIVGALAIKFLIKFIEKYSFRVFGWYRIIIGLIVIFLVLIARI